MGRRIRQLELRARTWDGRRAGAGRKPSAGRRSVPHRCRPSHDPRCPVHVTMRVCAGLPSLRRADIFGRMSAAFGVASNGRFRLLHFSVQPDHVHLLVEAEDEIRLRRALQGLAIRAARAINRALRRHGRVWSDRYHARELGTPREVRHALVYVLQNWRKHLSDADGLDPLSSAVWFNGWRKRPTAPAKPSPVVEPQTWLGRIGWRRHGLVGLDEAPRSPVKRPHAVRTQTTITPEGLATHDFHFARLPGREWTHT